MGKCQSVLPIKEFPTRGIVYLSLLRYGIRIGDFHTGKGSQTSSAPICHVLRVSAGVSLNRYDLTFTGNCRILLERQTESAGLCSKYVYFSV